MAGTNTEKPSGRAEQKKQAPVKTQKKAVENKAPVKTEEKKETKPVEEKIEDKKPNETKTEEKPAKPQKKVKKDLVVVNARSVPVSTKYAIAICRFIKNKTPDKAVEELEQVVVLKKSIPMRGEIPHRKGPSKAGSGSGRFPQKAAKEFINLVKSLKSNAENHDLEEPVIVEAIANFAHRPWGRGGKLKKRTHIALKAKSRNKLKKKTEKKTTKKIVKNPNKESKK